MFGLDGILGKLVSNAGGGDEGGKTRARTHLATDQTLTYGAILVPLVLLFFSRTFAPSTFRASSLNCAPHQTATYTLSDDNVPVMKVSKSGNANRFYMNNYCWERLHHQILNDSSSDENNIIGSESLDINKYFPYFMFALIIFVSFPVLVWTRLAQTNVQPQTEFLVSGLREAMGMTIQSLMRLHKEEKLVENKTDHNGNVFKRNIASPHTIYMHFEEEYEKQAENLGAKFSTFTSFVRAKAKQNNIVRQFFVYRLANMLSLIVSSILLYRFSLKSTRAQFNCMCPFSPSDLDEADQVYEMVSCNINGVIVRQYMTWIWLIANIFLLLAGLFGTANDLLSAKNASTVLKITEPICRHNMDAAMDKTPGITGLNDLHILLMLAKHNFGHNSIIAMCLQANTMMRFLGEDKLTGRDRNGPYLRQLASQISWHIEEELDAEVDKVLEETKENRG